MIDLIISAVLKGGMYILISMGLSLVYGVMKIPNFAHGEFYLIGAYCAYVGLSHVGTSWYCCPRSGSSDGFCVWGNYRAVDI